ncbi:MAG TPA: preprotein translocase subunit SecE [Parachlamydiaceae bacterium]|nr:preprotein translocase subunit SecE [Parachlamydiaceae bacterium]
MAVELKTMELKKRELIVETPKEVKEMAFGERTVKSHKLWDFIADVKQELSKITWTTPEELRAYTKIVIAATFCFGIGVYIIDLMIQMVLGTLESAIRFIGG